MLELRGLHARYGNILALKGVNLQVDKGEIVTLLGANGAGKSTVLMSICGLVPPSSGELLFEGVHLGQQSTDAIVRLGICQVPEGRRIFPQLSVQENLDMGAFLRSGKAQIQADRDYIFELFPALAERRHQHGGLLSGGEQQMLALSRALMARPKLLLLDEPSMGLAPLIIGRIFEIIERINSEQGTTILLVEQNANQALKVAHRGYVLENGKVVLQDTASNLLGNQAVQEAYLGV